MPKARILLMYITQVSGHRSAASAIEGALRLVAPDTEILNIDAFHYTNPISERIVNRIYMGMIRNLPFIWKHLYDNTAVAKGIGKFKDAVHKINSPKFKRLFDQFKPDAVVCTQAFPCGMVADFKRYYRSSIPLVAVLTDYVPHAYWIYDNIDYYIAPSQEVGAALKRKGVPAQKIKPLGIPFDPRFNEPSLKEEIANKLGLDIRIPAILIMGGGQGLGPIKEIVDWLQGSARTYQVIIVTGTNKRLYNFFLPRIKTYRQKTLLYGYTGVIHELMSASDIIVTKPGGITTAEALAKNLPMLIVRPIPGQEASNAAYLTRQGAAVNIDDPAQILPVIEGILDTPGKLIQMRQSAAAISKPNSSLDIARLVLGLSAALHA